MSSDKPLAIVALGGNTILRQGDRGTVYEQFARTRQTVVQVGKLIRRGWRIVITHGNGPQVGDRLQQVESAMPRVPETPLGIIVAETQGAMGYMVGQTLQNWLHLQNLPIQVATVLTQVIVDKDDPNMLEPTKFIGDGYDELTAKRLMKSFGWPMREHKSRGWRRVVPSPVPLEIVELPTLRALLERDTVVVCCGGGGMPVYREEDGRFEGVDGVVDKDLASSRLATGLEADIFMMLTEVDRVALNFATPDAKPIDRMTVSEARNYLEEGQFPPGSMGPKIQGAIDFLETVPNAGGRRVIVTNPEIAPEAIEGREGTWIVPDRPEVPYWR